MAATTPLEKKISAKIRQFNIVALLRLLVWAGYPREKIRFKSHPGISSQKGLIQDIEFREAPERRVVISMNLGLLSAQSPIPSYFLKMIDRGDIEPLPFNQFIGYFDHPLIFKYLMSIYSEGIQFLFPDFRDERLRSLQTLDLTSCSALHWLLRLVVPELGVSVEKAIMQHDIRTVPLRLGKSVIGSDATFGEKKRSPVYGRRITFYSDDEATPRGDPWSKEIKKRLNDLIFPLLHKLGLDVEIFLIIRTQASYAKLHSQSYLGYDKIRGGEESMRSIRLFRGRI